MQYAILPLDEYKSMCDIMRESTGKEGSLTSTELLNNMLTINGKTVYYDEYWDTLQQFGNKTDYSSAFTPARGFNLTTFRPKYTIRPTKANNMFQGFMGTGSIGKDPDNIDLVEYLNTLGIELDFSLCTNVNTCFRDCGGFNHIGIVNLQNCTSMLQFYYRSGGYTNCLTKIDKLILPHHISAVGNAFTLCTRLTSVDFEMVDENSFLGGESITIAHAPFDAPTSRSLIKCLENYMGTESEYTYTFTLTQDSWLLLNADTNNPPPQGDTWQAYVQTLGWNVG